MNFVKKTLAIFLLLIVVAFSGGVSISKHFCKGKIASRAFNSEVKVCKKSGCKKHNSNGLGYNKPSCCDTDQAFFKSFNFEHSSFEVSYFLAFVDVLYPSPVISTTATPKVVDNYRPPSGGPPIYVWEGRFLI